MRFYPVCSYNKRVAMLFKCANRMRSFTTERVLFL